VPTQIPIRLISDRFLRGCVIRDCSTMTGALKVLRDVEEQCSESNSSARHRMTPTWNPGLDSYPQTVGSGVVHLAVAVCR
jgi:hypothetical protein